MQCCQNPTMVRVGNAKIPSIRAHQIKQIVLKHENENIPNRLFCVQPKKHEFTAKLPLPDMFQSNRRRTKRTEDLQMKALQLPIVCNNATTGHKLQGHTIEASFVQSLVKVK